MALGATPSKVLWLVLRHGLALAGLGAAIGVALGDLAVRPLAAFLVPEVRPADPANFVVVAAILGLVAMAATFSPALRVDPGIAPRSE